MEANYIMSKEAFDILRRPKVKGDKPLTIPQAIDYINLSFGLLYKVSKINLIEGGTN